jgi:hypothetical protein
MHVPQSLLDQSAIADLAYLALTSAKGSFVEVGVYKGGSAAYLYALAPLRGVEVFLYDTFTGIPFCDPAAGDTVPVGTFDDTSADAVRRAMPDAHVYEGVFGPDSPLPHIVGFAHIDCDQYDSVRVAINLLAPRMALGGVMLFDDYELTGARRAIDDASVTRHLKLHRTPSGKVFFTFGSV